MRISLCTDSWFELCYSIISAAEKPITRDLIYLQVCLTVSLIYDLFFAAIRIMQVPVVTCMNIYFEM